MSNDETRDNEWEKFWQSTRGLHHRDSFVAGWFAALASVPVPTDQPITYSEAEFGKMLAERDEWFEQLNSLIYSLATVEQIGEWSNANDPVDEFKQLIHRERHARAVPTDTKELIEELRSTSERYVEHYVSERLMKRAADALSYLSPTEQETKRELTRVRMALTEAQRR